MKRIAMLIAAAALLNACGGGSDQAESQASASSQLSTARTSAAGSLIPGAGDINSAGSTKAIEFGAVTLDRINASLLKATGSVDVWIGLSQPSAAVRQGARIEATGAKLARGESNAALAAVDAEQASTINLLASLGAEVMGRVRLSHNAIAVRVDAAQLAAISSIGNVVSVNPVVHPVLALAETVPYVGAAAAQAVGKDGRGTRIAVLDSGIDYTHAAFGGLGTVAAYVAAAGVNPPNPATPTTDPRALTLDGLFPTAKVIGGFDFVGEAWPVGARTEDPDPIDRQGHGTSVGHIAAGLGGVAPGASLYAIKVCSAVATSCNGIALLLGMDFALDPNGDGEIDDAVDVINMSLGSAYGQIEDDLTQASSNASKAGVVVVAAAGNNADHPYIVSSPSIAAEAISVAQTQVPSALARFAALTISPAPPGQPNPNTNLGIQDWALPSTTPTNGQLVYVGRGCPAGSVPVEDPYVPVPAGASIAGSILLIDRGTCNASLKVDRAARAGAVGVVIADNVAAATPPIFGVGGGSIFVPTVTTTLAYGNALKALLAGTPAVTASIQLTAQIPLVGGIVSTSSRGPSVSTVTIKPEIGAPGASVAAVVGTGTGAAPFGGTSGATPMIAGAAAIMKQVHPTRSPMIIKALLMNSAETDIRTNPAAGPDLAPITRIGAGELRVDRALALEAVAFVPKDKSAAISFGFHAVSTFAEAEREVRVVNLSRRSETFSIASSFRFAKDEASGAVALSMPSSITVGARDSKTFTVRITIDASKLPEWTMTDGFISGSGPELTGLEFDGYVTLQGATDTLSLPWHLLPRRAAAVNATPRSLVVGNPIVLANPSVTDGPVDVFALTGVSPRADRDLLPDPGDNFAFIDLRAVGLRPAGVHPQLGPLVQFAMNTFGARSHPNHPAEFSILVDANRDGTPDYEIFNAENGGFGATGQSVAFVQNLSTPTAPARGFFFTGGGLNTGNMIFTLPLFLLAPTAPATGPSVTLDQPFNFRVRAVDNYFTGNITDEIGVMTHTLATPHFAAVADVVVVGAGTAGLLGTSAPAGGAAASPSQIGLLMIYTAAELRNKGEADIIRLRERRR